MVKTSVYWAATFSVDGTYILKISLMGSVIQRVRPNHFSKKLLKYIFMKLDFINI